MKNVHRLHPGAARALLLGLGLGCGQPPVEEGPATTLAALAAGPPICPAFTHARGDRCVPAPWAELTAAPTNARALTDLADLGGRQWAVGGGGVVLTSLDGATFGRVDAGTGEDLLGFDTYDGRHLLLTGASRLHISDNGGRRFWASAPAPAGIGRCGYAPGAAAICGDRAGDRIYRYDFATDRFATVATVAGAFNVLARAGNRLALALGDTGAGTVVLRSVDSGSSFDSTPVTTLPERPASLWIAGNDRLVLIGTQSGKIYRSADGGGSFTAVYAPVGSIDLGFPAAHVGGLDASHVFAAIQITRGFMVKTNWLRVARSTDGGRTWSDGVEVEDGAGLADFGTPTRGLVLGGHILRTDDGGATLTAVDQQAFAPWAAAGFPFVGFLSPTLGFVGYQDPPTSFHGPARSVLARTTDGGASFGAVYTGRVTAGSGAPPVRGFSAPDAAHLFVDAGTGLARSSDGGDTWEGLAPPPFADGPFAFATPALGLIAAAEPGVQLYRTTDGGDSFSPVSLPVDVAVSAVAFADADHAVVTAGDGSIFSSQDGGASFTAARVGAPGDSLTALALAGSVGWAGGSATGGALLLRTRDGGKTWTRQPLGAGAAVTALSAGSARRAGALVQDGLGGAALLVTNDGRTWRPVATPGGPLAVSVGAGGTTFVGTISGVSRRQEP